ncbi:hypothetical protein [Geodermatophilus chilensis]|jgi:hypothetical protein|uniref:hypothetical protein n=1 Tax=Geodermatophilus chilensis TaxID=2035835 RepID=UPI000C26AD69|nr:hypothetical protein [Geodermatophilus chilensis]
MSEPMRNDAGAAAPPPSADPTVRVERPPIPGRAVRAQLAAGEIAAPPVRQDEPTVSLDAPVPAAPHGTLKFDGPPPIPATPDPEPVRRRRRTWPWILAVVLALVVLGAVLLVMLWRGATIDGDVDLVGARLAVPGDLVGWSGGAAPR